MQFKHFGRTGLSVSRLCLGTGAFGYQTGEAEAFRILGAAADAGVNFIDTANTYPAGALPHEIGSSEEITGRWLKDVHCRHKGRRGHGAVCGGQGRLTQTPTRRDRRLLRRLRTDYVDLYQIHT